MKQILLFSIIGVLGFVVDATLTILFTKVAYFQPIYAKLASFPFAVTVTWLLNRFFTFASKNSDFIKEWCTFVKVSLAGALINNLAFYLAIIFIDFFSQNIIFSVALGSVAGMLFNFFGSKFYVFKK